MNSVALRSRLSNANPWLVDGALAVVLTILVWLQIRGFGPIFRILRPSFEEMPSGDVGVFHRPPPEFLEAGMRSVDFGFWPYVVVALAFLPLVARRRWPTAVLLLVSGAALFYFTQAWPPAFVIFGPMIALATVASLSTRGRTALYVVLVAAIVALGSTLAYSDTRWVVQAIGMVALLVAAAFYGDSIRSRREYIEAVEARALEAERTREEEALRRVDDERIRIAREVHDIVAHGLSVVTVQAQAGLSTLAKDADQTRSSLETIRHTGKEALGELRSMLGVLRSGDGDAPREPVASLADLVGLAETVRDAGIEVELAVGGNVASLPEFIELSAFRIVQEALTNVMRHSHATRASVTLYGGMADLSVEVIDDGTGTPQGEGGHGIEGMRERAAALGGTFSAGPRDEGGFRVSATIPLPRSVR